MKHLNLWGRALLIAVLVSALPGCRWAGATQAQGQKLSRVLVFSHPAWYRHEAIPQINPYLVKLGAENGFAVDATEDASAFNAPNLARYQVVVFNNTTDIGKSLDDNQKQSFIDWFHRGGGYVGLHSASVHHNTWPWYAAMLGTNFNSDVEHQRAKVIVDKEGKGHPTVRHLPPESWISEEWMSYETSVRGLPGTTVLLRIDESTYNTTPKPYFRDKGGRPMGTDHPISWARNFEGGRVFYTNFGHDLQALSTEPVRKHVLEGIRWAARAAPQEDR